MAQPQSRSTQRIAHATMLEELKHRKHTGRLLHATMLDDEKVAHVLRPNQRIVHATMPGEGQVAQGPDRQGQIIACC